MADLPRYMVACLQSGKLAFLAILVSGGIVLQILACALYNNWWPMLSVIMYVLLPMPMMFFAGSDASSLFTESSGNRFQIQSKMGLLWWKSKGKSEKKPTQKAGPKTTEVPGMNGAVEVPRRPPSEVTVFEFGSVANSADKVTVAGYCPISDELEPCRWEILPPEGPDAPQFRIVF